jgi:hypothetical protein
MAIDSWGGALLFIAFLAEMRHPMDFWKGLLLAQCFIGFVYVLFGAFVSNHQVARGRQFWLTVVLHTGLQPIWSILCV